MSENSLLETSTLAHREGRLDGRYTLLGLLGRGGMAEVFRVHDAVTGQERALKRLLPERATQGSTPLTQFEREYHTLCQLEHPCVIKVYDYATGADGTYYTMELLDGSDLQRIGQLAWREVCAVLSDVISVLALLHARKLLHRDLSPRNVVRTSTGRSKLIDFGAMAPIGTARTVVGTPPYVPPEALQQLTLDARADLYAFGALAYRLLTGRNAYPARTFKQLPDLFRTRPLAPDKLVEGLPEALSKLVLELISLDRGGRPGTAPEVMERLEPFIERSSVRPARNEAPLAYLASPKLIGRERVLLRARRFLVRCLQGRGAGMLVEGPPGVGRSRFLDMCVLESRLLGATVLRANGADGASGDYGAARSLAEQLVTALPEVALSSARLQQHVLGHVVPALAPGVAQTAPPPEPRHLHTALRDWFRNVARDRRVVLAIDDLDRIDEPSAALLAALAHRIDRRRLSVIATLCDSATKTPAIELFAQISERVELTPLSALEVESLLQSIFGSTHNLAPCAEHLHRLSHGNPRQVMQLADHLVQRGSARFSHGSWSLPERLSSAHLPESVDAALGERLERLRPNARKLAEALSLTDPSALGIDDYPRLIREATRPETFDAVAELVSAEVLEAEGDRYRFAHPRFFELLTRSMPSERRRELHVRLLELRARFRDPVELPEHLLESGQTLRAVEHLIEQRARDLLPPSTRAIRVHERALEAAVQSRLGPRYQLKLELGLVVLGGRLGRLDVFLRHVDRVQSALEQACGILEFNNTSDLPPRDRAARALKHALERSTATPEERQTFEPLAALRELAWLRVTFDMLSRITLDPALCERLPALSAFVPDSELATLTDIGHEALRCLHLGRFAKSRALKRQLLAQIRQNEAALSRDPNHANALSGLLTIIGSEEALLARKQTSDYVDALREQPGTRAAAFRIRALFEHMRGNVAEAWRCQRRAQLLSLQDQTREQAPGLDVLNLALATILSDDLLGLRQRSMAVEQLAAAHPRWTIVADLVRCHQLRLAGTLPAALELCSALARRALPFQHIAACWVASCHVWLLLLNGDANKAVEEGRRYQAAFAAGGCELSDYFDLARALAEALARSGAIAEAVAMADAVVAELEGKGIAGILLGVSYETRARVAQEARDAEGFQRFAQLCGRIYRAYENPALSAKHARLTPPIASETLALPSGTVLDLEQESEAGLRTEWSHMAECIGRRERAQYALTVVLEQFGASEGHLYGLMEGSLAHLASRPSAPEDETSLRQFLESKLQAELAAEHTTGGAEAGADEANAGLQRRYRVAVLAVQRDGEPMIAAIAAVGCDGRSTAQDPGVLSILAEGLLAYDDVDPMTQLL